MAVIFLYTRMYDVSRELVKEDVLLFYKYVICEHGQPIFINLPGEICVGRTAILLEC